MILRALIHFSGHLIFFPFYHAVDDEDQPHIEHLYPVKKIKQFEHELDVFLRHFDPISMDDLVQIQKGQKKIKGPSFLLSFDDGLKQCHDIIAPILLKRGIPATFFINSAFVGNKELMYRYKVSLLVEEGLLIKKLQQELNHNHIDAINDIDIDDRFSDYLENQKPYMSLEQIKKLESDGFTIGAHSHSHPYFKDISLKHQIEQVIQSTQFIKTHLTQKHKVFAFPFDDVGVSNQLFKAIGNQIDLYFSSGGIKKDERSDVFRRTSMEEQSNPKRYIYSRYAKALGKQILKIKHIHHR